MAALTGRTVSKWCAFKYGDGTTMQNILIDSINGIGLDYDEVELTAFSDAIKGVLPGHPGLTIEITGPFDSTASTGTHVLLSADAGGVTPRSFDFQIGVRAAWEAGAPQFGISASSTSGLLCTSYMVDPSGVSYSARFGMFPGSSAPAWGTAVEVVLA